MREGMRTNVLLPKIIVNRVKQQLDRMVDGKPDDSGFYRPFRRFPAAIPAADQARLSAAGLERVRATVIPAFARLRDFIAKDYLPACYDQVGWWQTSSGLAGYAYLARLYTTTDLTPQQIHEIGLKEVARIKAEMEQVKTEAGFTGTLPEFFTYLRTDPRFYYKTPEDLLDGYRAVAKRIDPELVKVIGTPPRLPYGVTPIPDAVAPNVTTAYANAGAPDGSRPAYFFVNLYKPETRPKWEMLTLTLHEAVPGHCLQASIAQERTDMPAFRRNAGFTAYVEGWALYSESLGEDMGLYRTTPTHASASSPTRCGAPCGWSSTPACTRCTGTAQRAITLLHGERRKDRARRHQRDRPLHRLAWPGARLQDRRAEDQGAARPRRTEARQPLRPPQVQRRRLAMGAVPLEVLEQQVDVWIAGQTR